MYDYVTTTTKMNPSDASERGGARFGTIDLFPRVVSKSHKNTKAQNGPRFGRIFIEFATYTAQTYQAHGARASDTSHGTVEVH